LKEFISIWVRMLAPFAPHSAEEAWRAIGGEGFVTAAKWPEFDESKIEDKWDEMEELVRETLEDTQEILATTKIAPKKVHYYTAAKWKWRIYLEALDRAQSRPETLDGLIKDMIGAKTPAPKDLPKYTAKVTKQARTMPPDMRARRIRVGELDEKEVLMEATSFLAREVRAEVEVYSEDDADLYDPKEKAKFAEPYRPAIYVE